MAVGTAGYLGEGSASAPRMLCPSLLWSSSAWNILSKGKMHEGFGNSHDCSLLFCVMLLLLAIVKMTKKI